MSTTNQPFSSPFGEPHRIPEAPYSADPHLSRFAATDVIEFSADVELTIEIPGVKSEDLEVEIENNVLTIRGEKRADPAEAEEGAIFHLSERRYGSFARSFLLPSSIDQDSAEASSYRDGILRLSLRKKHTTLYPQREEEESFGLFDQTEPEWIEEMHSGELGTGIFLVSNREPDATDAVMKEVVENLTYAECSDRALTGMYLHFKWVPHRIAYGAELRKSGCAGGPCSRGRCLQPACACHNSQCM